METVNVRKSRKIAQMIRRLIGDLRKEKTISVDVAKDAFDMIDDLAKELLITPPRNCDVGTPQEQAERYGRYCDQFTSNGMHCETCPCCGKIPFGRCEFAWAQLPYNGGEENAK